MVGPRGGPEAADRGRGGRQPGNGEWRDAGVIASQQGHTEALKLLQEAGADVNLASHLFVKKKIQLKKFQLVLVHCKNIGRFFVLLRSVRTKFEMIEK